MLSRFTSIRISVLALGAFAVAALLLAAACGDDDSTTTTPTAAAAQPTSSASPTTAPTQAVSPTAAPSTAASAATTLKTGTGGALGTVITDANGMTLYTFDEDKTPGKSSCNTGCVGAWPPVVVSAAATRSTDISGDVTTITRDDGAQQVAYKGRPLYRFAGDTKPGDTNGQGISGTWFVAKP